MNSHALPISPQQVECDSGCTARRRAAHLASAGVLVGIFPLAYAMTPLLLQERFPLCAFRCATGKPCPFCGLTRAVGQATHLHWREAFAFNPLWPLAVAMLLLFAGLHLIDARRGSRLTAAASGVLLSRWVWILAALLVFDAFRIW